MKSIIMSIKSSNLTKVSLLVIFTSLLPLTNASAQRKALTYQDSGAPIEVGDSVMVNRDSLYYETGERILHWVYDQVHEVRQVSSKYHPDGILVRGIYSWLKVGSIMPLNEKKVVKSDTILPELVTVKDSIDVEYVPDSISMEKPVVAPIVEDTIDSIPPVEPIEEEVIPYQVNRFTIGIRGGFASSMAKATVDEFSKLPLGFDAILDLQYAHYWSAAKNKVRLGLLAGVSAGYMNTNRNQPWDDTFSVNTSDGEIVYNVTADNIHEVNHQIQLEVPVMFSMITNSGFFFNVGPRFLLPTYTPYKQTITNGNITVTDLETGVVLNDNPVYGALSAEQENQKGKGEQQFMLTMTIGFEVGYEFKLKSGNSIGLGAFFNYGVYSMYSNNPLGSAIDVTEPNATDNGVVRVESLTNAYTDKMGHLDAGVKITYNLDFIKK